MHPDLVDHLLENRSLRPLSNSGFLSYTYCPIPQLREKVRCSASGICLRWWTICLQVDPFLPSHQEEARTTALQQAESASPSDRRCRDQRRMAATRYEARGAVREPDVKTPGRRTSVMMDLPFRRKSTMWLCASNLPLQI